MSFLIIWTLVHVTKGQWRDNPFLSYQFIQNTLKCKSFIIISYKNILRKCFHFLVVLKHFCPKLKSSGVNKQKKRILKIFFFTPKTNVKKQFDD